jgi:hypothetical protein
VQVRTKQLDTLDVVPLVKLLVNRVSSVGRASHREQQDILSGSLLESQSDRDRSTLTSVVRLNTEDVLDSLSSGKEVPVLGRRDPPLSFVHELVFNGVLGVQVLDGLLKVLENGLVDLRKVHVGDGTDRKLSSHGSGDHGLCSRSRESSLNSVDGKRGVSPTGLEDLLLSLVDGSPGSEGFVDIVHGEGNTGVKSLLLRSDGSNHLRETLDEDLALVVDEGSEEGDEVGHRLNDGSSEDTGVEVGSGSADPDGVVRASTESVGQARLLGSEPAAKIRKRRRI